MCIVYIYVYMYVYVLVYVCMQARTGGCIVFIYVYMFMHMYMYVYFTRQLLYQLCVNPPLYEYKYTNHVLLLTPLCTPAPILKCLLFPHHT
jgi:hypothetical protein